MCASSSANSEWATHRLLPALESRRSRSWLSTAAPASTSPSPERFDDRRPGAGQGDTIELAWDAEDRLISSVDPLGNTTTLSYDDAGRLVSRTNDLGANPLASQARAPRDINGFDYAYSNPLRFKDPSGKAPSGGGQILSPFGAMIATLLALFVAYSIIEVCGTLGAWDCLLGALGAIPVAAVASKMVFWLGIVAAFLGMGTLFVKWLWVDEIGWSTTLFGLFSLGTITALGIYFSMLVSNSSKLGKAGATWAILGLTLTALYLSWHTVNVVEGRKRPLFQ